MYAYDAATVTGPHYNFGPTNGLQLKLGSTATWSSITSAAAGPCTFGIDYDGPYDPSASAALPVKLNGVLLNIDGTMFDFVDYPGGTKTVNGACVAGDNTLEIEVPATVNGASEYFGIVVFEVTATTPLVASASVSTLLRRRVVSSLSFVSSSVHFSFWAFHLCFRP